MGWLSDALNSSLGRKLVMSLTGLFLILFLVGHLVGNTLLFNDDGGKAFNEYARFMTSNPVIQILSITTYVSIILHVIWSIIITRKNRQARPVSYAVSNSKENSLWTSRNMGILGTIVLIFLIIHLKSFWYEMKFGEMPMISYGDGTDELKDLYSIVAAAFSQWWYVAIYVIAMGGLAFHLSHGFKSAFQTLGLTHKKYTPLIEGVGFWFSIVIPALFALMPIVMFIQSLA